ncbi:MAG TPA: hypothetical protein VIN32_00665, partial [Candidatus Limnocylindria bacterium]
MERIFLEAIDACSDQAAERVGNSDPIELLRRPPPALLFIPLDGADIDEHPHEFLYEERIPIGLPKDQGTQIGRELRRAEQARGHTGAVVLAQRFERHLHEP